MSKRIIDCCSLLNLYTGWRGLAELSILEVKWYICDAVLQESEFTREIAEDGKQVPIPLDLNQFVDAELLTSIHPESELEIADYVNFSTEIDDGEAQALALAKNRKLILLTDDRKATSMARRIDVSVPTITTADVLQEWTKMANPDTEIVKTVVRRITTLARFHPDRDSVAYQWWTSHL